jgi:hypothetical protein
MNYEGRIVTEKEITDGAFDSCGLYFKLTNGFGDWAWILNETPFSYFVRYCDSNTFGSIYKNEIDKIYLILP